MPSHLTRLESFGNLPNALVRLQARDHPRDEVGRSWRLTNLYTLVAQRALPRNYGQLGDCVRLLTSNPING